MADDPPYFDVAYPIFLLLLDENKTGMILPTATGEQALAVITNLALAEHLCEIFAKRISKPVTPHAITGDAEILKHLHAAAKGNIKRVLFFEPSGANTLRHEISIESAIRTFETAISADYTADN